MRQNECFSAYQRIDTAHAVPRPYSNHADPDCKNDWFSAVVPKKFVLTAGLPCKTRYPSIGVEEVIALG